jgi:hypothetical protein
LTSANPLQVRQRKSLSPRISSTFNDNQIYHSMVKWSFTYSWTWSSPWPFFPPGPPDGPPLSPPLPVEANIVQKRWFQKKTDFSEYVVNIMRKMTKRKFMSKICMHRTKNSGSVVLKLNIDSEMLKFWNCELWYVSIIYSRYICLLHIHYTRSLSALLT